MAFVEITNNINYNAHTDKTKISDNFEKKIMSDTEQNEHSMYKESINAYQFQVGRHQHSMNYFALFNGALLVAYCTLLTSTTSVKSQLNGIYCLSNDYEILNVIISILGLIASLTWFFSIKGNVFWINNWMKCIELCKTYNPYLFVFSEEVKNDNEVLPKDTYFRGCYSTQKLSLVFVFFVILAWISALLFICFNIASKITKIDEHYNCSITSNASNHPVLFVLCIFVTLTLLIILSIVISFFIPRVLKKITMSNLSGKIGRKIK